MSTPKHTYTYYRTGVGDVIVLTPSGHPYVGSSVLPAGWEANYWSATDRLASIHDAAKWTQIDIESIPSDAAKVLVSVTLAPTAGAEALKVTVSTDNYKAAAGLQYTDSGSHKTNFAEGGLGPPGDPLHWFDFTDTSTLFLDTSGTQPALLQGDRIARVNNKGTDGTHLQSVTADERPALDLTFGSLPSFDGDVVDTSVLSNTIANGHAGDYTFAMVLAPENTGLAEIAFGWPAAITTTGMGMRQTATAIHNILASDEISLSVATYSVDTYIAGIGISRVANTQQFFHSLDAGSKSGSQPHNAIANSSLFSIGASDAIGGFDFQGHVGEVIVWPSEQTIQPIKDYITGRYGIIWA